MSERDTIVAIHAQGHDALGRPGRCLHVARGRTVLERTAGLAGDIPRIAGVFILSPVSGQAMTLGRMFKNKIDAGFLALLGGRAMPTYRRLLQKHNARYLMVLQGDNLLYSRDLLKAALETCTQENKPVFFDNGHGAPHEASVLGRVDAAPAECVERAASRSESTAAGDPRLLESLCGAAGMTPLGLAPGKQVLADLFKLNFDNRLFSAQSLAVAMTGPLFQRPVPDPAASDFMDSALFRTVCDELVSLGRSMGLDLGHGGDPLLHPEIFSCIEYAAGLGLPVSVFTSGLFLNEQKAGALCGCGLDSVTVSIDALDRDTFFDLHRMPLGPVENNVLRLLKLRESMNPRMRIRVCFTINPINKNEVLGFFNKWSRLVDEVVFEKQCTPQGKITSRDLPGGAKRHACERFLKQPVLTHTGEIIMCRVPDAARTLACGSVHERGVMGALTHHGTRELFARKPATLRGKPCSGCDLWRPETFCRNAPDDIG